MVAAAAAAAAWVGQVPGGPGQSRQPGSTLSLLKCAEANIIAPKRGQRNKKQTENRMNITELKGTSTPPHNNQVR